MSRSGLLPFSALLLCAALAGCDLGRTPAEAALSVAPAAPGQTSSGETLLPSAPAQADELADIKTDDQASVVLPPSGQLSWDWSARPRSQAQLVLLDARTAEAQVAAYANRGTYTVCVLDAVEPSRVAALNVAFDLCQHQGFDAVVVADLFADGKINRATQVADLAHNAGLAILHWGGEQYASERDGHGRQVADVFDGALTEHCLRRDTCTDTLPYLQRGKQVLNVEDARTPATVRKQLDRLGLLTLWR